MKILITKKYPQDSKFCYLYINTLITPHFLKYNLKIKHLKT